MSYSSVLVQSQRVFIASKPKSLLMIFIFLTEFPTDILEDAMKLNTPDNSCR